MKATTLGIEFIMCDALIDQGKYIGDDAVGYKCCKPATRRYYDNDICDTCREILTNSPNRVSFIKDYVNFGDIENWKNL